MRLADTGCNRVIMMIVKVESKQMKMMHFLWSRCTKLYKTQPTASKLKRVQQMLPFWMRELKPQWHRNYKLHRLLHLKKTMYPG